MSDKLKNGWTRVAFGDVVKQVRDRVDPESSDIERYVAGEHMDTDDLKIRRWGIIGDGYLGPAFHMRFKPGHVLYGSRRTYLRKVALADFEGITANTTFVLESKDPEVLLPELLPFIMQTESFHEHSIKQSKGSVNPYVNFSDLAWHEFALPPLDEQRRIAEVLGAADQVCQSWWHTMQFFDKLYDAMSRTLFKHNLSERNKISKEYGWRKYKFGEVAKLQRGHDLPTDQRKTGDVAVCGANGICGSHSKAMYNGPGVITGRSGTIGEIYFVEKAYWPLNTTLFVKEFYGNNPKFVYHLLKSLNCKRFSAGSAVPTLNRNDIHSIEVYVPEPTEQTEIADKFDTLERFGANILQHYYKISEMRKSLLIFFLEDNAP